MTIIESPMKDFVVHICANCSEKDECAKSEKDMLTCADILAARSLSFISNYLAAQMQFCAEQYK